MKTIFAQSTIICRDIPAGTELLVWYGDAYSQFMGIPLTLNDGKGDTRITPLEHESKYRINYNILL